MATSFLATSRGIVSASHLGAEEVEQGSALLSPCRTTAMREIGKAGALPYFHVKLARLIAKVATLRNAM
ncbi:MAG: hypothetical protein A3K18_15175 [Lentisphaerae bacterium RIFOXYA12_64_32]|nr:MAG: hypothetical protein A3K18_15175 [Lentisphaerae bacterium RIFOXYA12_64_32]